MAVIDYDKIRSDIAFVRAARQMKIATVNGDVALQWQPGSRNALIDLRSLSASGELPPNQIPDQTGHSGAILVTDGASPYWYSNAEVVAWKAAAVAAGGTFTARSVPYANRLMLMLSRTPFDSKIIYLQSMLGGNLATACVPLRDTLGAGIATPQNLTEANFSEETGLQGNGVNASLDLLIKPSQLGSGNNGGLFYWENNIAFGGTGVEPIGTYNNSGNPAFEGSNRFVIDLRGTQQTFIWGLPANRANIFTAAGNAFYYGQRSSATSREIFRNGSSLASDATNDATSGSSDRNLKLLACDYNEFSTKYWAGRCAVAGLTDGTLTASEVASLYALLGTYLIDPTGR